MSVIRSVKITKWKGATQMASRVNDHETGFADIIMGKEEKYVDKGSCFIKKTSNFALEND